MDIKSITEQFKIGGTFISAVPHGSGHINDSFKVTFIESGNTFHYLFQRINHNVFLNPPRVMDNIELATNRIRRKLKANGTANIHRRVLTTIPTHEKRSFFKTPAGDYWRAYHFITGAATHDELQSPEQAFQVAKAFAGFQEMLRDLPTATLHETIPDFHNGPKRFETFQKVLKADSFNRAKEARKEIEFIEERAFVFDLLPGLVREGKIALRVTHNDTKVNNVLLDEKTGRGICVIDLDTVMPGVSLYDFGDLARSVLSDVPEDSQDLSAVAVNLPVFEALTKGFLGVSEGFLSALERGLLIFSAQLMTQMIGLRFLTDYLQGDTYFKTRRKEQNLDRARRQLKMVQEIITQQEEIDKRIRPYSGNQNLQWNQRNRTYWQ